MNGERERIEQVAPWLVFLSQHLPEVHYFDDIPAIGCMCGATRTLYVGHLARALADRDAAVRDEAAREAGAKALEDAAAQAEEIERLGSMPSIDMTAEERAYWRGSHLSPLVPLMGQRPRKVVASWLRDRAAALRAAPPTEGES